MDMARTGWRVAMVERSPEMIGGTCINLACIPSKTLIRSAEVAELVRRAPELGIEATLGEVRAATVRARKEAVVQGMRDMNLEQFRASGLELVIGRARFVAPRRVEVATGDGAARLLEGEHAVIDVGSRPAIPAIPGLEEARPLTSETLLGMDRIPGRLVVLGGGYVALEFAQAMRRFGSEVIVIERGSQLAREDDDIADAVRQILADDGIEIALDAGIRSVERLPDGTVRVDVETERGARAIVGDDVLAALGRTPNIEGLGLDDAGVRLDDRGYAEVDEHLRTTAPNTFAVGDVTGGFQFTHVSLDDYRIVKSALIGGDRTTTDRLIPYALFLDPELGRVGLTEREARRQGYDVRIPKLPAAAVPRAKTTGSTRGVLKAVVEREGERILGAAILAADAGEVIAVVQIAMLGGLPAPALRDAVLTHPTMAEGLNQLFASWTE